MNGAEFRWQIIRDIIRSIQRIHGSLYSGMASFINTSLLIWQP